MDNKDKDAKPQPKPACSTVLLQARNVQALNLIVEDLRTSPYALSAPTRLLSQTKAYKHNIMLKIHFLCGFALYVRKNEKRQLVEGERWQQPHRVGHKTGFHETPPPSFSDITLPKEWSY